MSIVLAGDIEGTGAPVPDSATAIVANVTVVGPQLAGSCVLDLAVNSAGVSTRVSRSWGN